MGSGNTVAEAIAERYKNQAVEIFLDSSVGTREYFDFSTEEKTVVDCVVKGADGEILIVECQVKTNMQSITCEVLINGWMIKGVIKQSYGVPLLTVLELEQKKTVKR